ncbi:hypothetical protein M3J07_012244 [Ascochyta lentis]
MRIANICNHIRQGCEDCCMLETLNPFLAHSSSHFGSSYVSVPSAGGPAIALSVLKYSSKSGAMVWKICVGPRRLTLSSSHLLCSAVEGKVPRPASTRATATA